MHMHTSDVGKRFGRWQVDVEDEDIGAMNYFSR